MGAEFLTSLNECGSNKWNLFNLYNGLFDQYLLVTRFRMALKEEKHVKYEENDERGYNQFGYNFAYTNDDPHQDVLKFYKTKFQNAFVPAPSNILTMVASDWAARYSADIREKIVDFLDCPP